MGVWSHIILEGFCMYSWMSKKKNHFYKMDSETMEVTGDKRTEINPHYIHHSKRPKWCRESNPDLIPGPHCYDDSCPFFAGCSASDVEHKLFSEMWKQFRTKDKFMGKGEYDGNKE